jgi:hypothetical protein
MIEVRTSEIKRRFMAILLIDGEGGLVYGMPRSPVEPGDS